MMQLLKVGEVEQLIKTLESRLASAKTSLD
jgi:hypothetical protein